MKNLTPAHIKYIVIRYHIQKIKIVDIYNELIAPRIPEEKVNKYGVVPLTHLSKDYFYTKIHKIDEESIQQIREAWMGDLLEIPLANKKCRVQELALLYEGSTDEKNKASFLKLIKEEVGEQGWQDAVKSSGTQVTVASGLTPEMMRTIARSVINDPLEYEDDDPEE